MQMHCIRKYALNKLYHIYHHLATKKTPSDDVPNTWSLKMPQAGIEPAREYKSRRILSPVRLPVPPLRHFHLTDVNMKWMEVDSNHRSNLQQIYSLSPLATRESIHLSVPLKDLTI